MIGEKKKIGDNDSEVYISAFSMNSDSSSVENFSIPIDIADFQMLFCTSPDSTYHLGQSYIPSPLPQEYLDRMEYEGIRDGI